MFVGAVLAVFFLTAAIGTDTWPLTGLRLFSHVRTSERVEYRAVPLDASGRERRLGLGSRSAAFRGFSLVAASLDELPVTRRREICRVWARAAAEDVPEISALRVQRVVTDLSRRRGDRAAPGTATALVSCRVRR